MNIPDSFRAAARAKAEKLIQTTTDEDRQQRIINEIAEEEWNQDRIEWRAYMNQMRAKSYQMYATPQDRKRHGR